MEYIVVEVAQESKSALEEVVVAVLLLASCNLGKLRRVDKGESALILACDRGGIEGESGADALVEEEAVKEENAGGGVAAVITAVAGKTVVLSTCCRGLVWSSTEDSISCGDGGDFVA